ncbi:heat shock 70 kDa protein 16-like protein [Tanacetum coccineum]
MFFAHLKQITEINLESPIEECVIGIPSYFTDLQRREYLDAAIIAGLKPLKLMQDCTAIALAYGMHKTDFPKSPTNVIFVDIGHCDTQVMVAAFERSQLKVLSHSFDQDLGGRDFDEVLFKHFASQFKEKYNIDVYSNTRASIRLRAACERLKKVLTDNSEAPLSIHRLIGDTNVEGFITREEFEILSLELLERIIVPCIKAVKDSGLSVDKIYAIELAGSGSRIPAIRRKLTSVLWKEPNRTPNASEYVARGCAPSIETIDWPNFNEWHRSLRIVLESSCTYDYLYKPCPDQPPRPATAEEKAQHGKSLKKHSDVACICLENVHLLCKGSLKAPGKSLLIKVLNKDSVICKKLQLCIAWGRQWSRFTALSLTMERVLKDRSPYSSVILNTRVVDNKSNARNSRKIGQGLAPIGKDSHLQKLHREGLLEVS